MKDITSCKELVRNEGIFSKNEEIEDINTESLKVTIFGADRSLHSELQHSQFLRSTCYWTITWQ